MGSVQPMVDSWVSTSRSKCATCNLRPDCIPAGLNARELARFEGLITPRHRVRRGAHLNRAGAELLALSALRCGSLKSTVADQDGREQIIGFHLPGELLGLDGIASGQHVSDVVALEDSEVCRFPFGQVQELSREIPTLAQHLRRLMSRELERTHRVMLVLGSMRAEERVATFLLDLAARLRARGYSDTQLVLRMTRAEIGSYLGLKLETVSRTFSNFQRDSIIDVQGKDIRIVDAEKLKSLAASGAAAQPAAPAAREAEIIMHRFPPQQAAQQAAQQHAGTASRAGSDCAPALAVD